MNLNVPCVIHILNRLLVILIIITLLIPGYIVFGSMPNAQNSTDNKSITENFTAMQTRSTAYWCIESPHPYPNNYNKTWLIGVRAAYQLRVHFTKIEIESGKDILYVLDAWDNIIWHTPIESQGIITYSDFWTPWVAGGVIKLRLSTDATGTCWGFKIDRNETQSIEYVKTQKVGMFYVPDDPDAITRIWRGNPGGYEACNLGLGLGNYGEDIDGWLAGLQRVHDLTYGRLKIIICPPWFGTKTYVQTITTPSGYEKDLYDVTIDYATQQCWIAELLERIWAAGLLDIIAGWYLADEPLGKFHDREAIECVRDAIYDAETEVIGVSVHYPTFVAYNLGAVTWLEHDGYNYNGEWRRDEVRHVKFFGESEIMIDWYGGPDEWAEYLPAPNIQNYIEPDGSNFHAIIPGGRAGDIIITETEAWNYINTILSIEPNCAAFWFWSWSFGFDETNTPVTDDSVDDHWEGDSDTALAKVAEALRTALNVTLLTPETNEIWYTGNTYNISWHIANGVPPYKVDIELWFGVEIFVITEALQQSTMGYYYYRWRIPADWQSVSVCTIQIMVRDTSDAVHYETAITASTFTLIHLNRAPYAPTLKYPANDSWLNISYPKFEWYFIDPDEADIQEAYQLQLAGNVTFDNIIFDTGIIASGETSCPVSIGISDGRWYWRVRTMDSHNKWSTWSNPPWCIKIDTTPPTEPPNVVCVSHRCNTSWYSTTIVAINWSAPSDLSGIVKYCVSFDNNASTIPIEQLNGYGSAQYLDASCTNITYINCASGIWYFHIQAQDLLGWWSAPSHYMLRIDVDAPIIEALDPADKISTGATIKFNFSIKDEFAGVARDEVILYWRYLLEPEFNMIELLYVDVNTYTANITLRTDYVGKLEYYVVARDRAIPPNRIRYPITGYMTLDIIDTEPPIVKFVTGNLRCNLTDDNIVLTVIATDNIDCASAKLHIRLGTSWLTITMHEAPNNTFTYTIPCTWLSTWSNIEYFIIIYDMYNNQLRLPAAGDNDTYNIQLVSTLEDTALASQEAPGNITAYYPGIIVASIIISAIICGIIVICRSIRRHRRRIQ